MDNISPNHEFLKDVYLYSFIYVNVHKPVCGPSARPSSGKGSLEISFFEEMKIGFNYMT